MPTSPPPSARAPVSDVDYDAIAALFLVPGETPIAEPAVPATPARRLRDSIEAIATQGWWSRAVSEQVAALGLDFFAGYVWGRAAALGDAVPGAVVAATFGVFEPGMIGAVYEQGRAAASRDAVLAARSAGASAALAAVVSEAEAAPLADDLLAALAAQDPTGRPLFSALRALPLPDTAAGRLWRAAELVREHRGDGHLAACVAAGLDIVTTNVLTELWLGYPLGEYSGTRGYGPEQQRASLDGLVARGWATADGALTPTGVAARVAVEDATDASQAALVAALGDRLEPIVAGCTAVSARILAAHSAPADPRKRAAG